jgi:hypothetical protein
MARTQAADIVGNLFFNTINIPCFVFSKEMVKLNQILQALPDFHLSQVCSARSWWGSCTAHLQKNAAVWRKPLPYGG